MEGVVCPIYKNDDKLDRCIYRAITLLSATDMVLTQILCRHLSPFAREFVGQYQAGFMDVRATSDQIFTIRQVLQKCREYNVPTHHLFIDFKSAYDTIDCDQLWQIMYEYRFPDKLTRLVKATMDRAMCMIDGDEIELIDEFVYLGSLEGSLVTAENDTLRFGQRAYRASLCQFGRGTFRV
ncbi:uncharacterized protein LOC135708673 [Ochlerotatus camptorhynchus]|uniref:uncharacterized protein LOC135708673 n=1 Tax=Ochlerotatus camptorhynchus TaxID=644619 RepID=UPI0031CF2240